MKIGSIIKYKPCNNKNNEKKRAYRFLPKSQTLRIFVSYKQLHTNQMSQQQLTNKLTNTHAQCNKCIITTYKTPPPPSHPAENVDGLIHYPFSSSTSSLGTSMRPSFPIPLPRVPTNAMVPS